MARKAKKEGGLEWWVSTAAALLILFSAGIDARLSVALAVIGLFALSFVMKDKFWKQVPFIIASIMVAMTTAVVLNQGEGLWPAVIMSGIVGALIIALVIYRRKTGAVLNDERTIAMHNRAMAYSWWIGYIAIAILFWFDYTDYLRLTAVQFGGVILFVMLVSQVLIKRYLLSRGDD